MGIANLIVGQLVAVGFHQECKIEQITGINSVVSDGQLLVE